MKVKRLVCGVGINDADYVVISLLVPKNAAHVVVVY